MQNRLLTPLVLLIVLGMAACGRSGNEKSPEHAEAPHDNSRVVCVSKQLNEIIYAIGAQNHLVGRDLTSVFPPEIKKLPSVGYHRLLSAEGIISLHPSVLFHDGNVAPAAVMTQLAKVGIPLREFPDAHTIDETKSLIRMLATELGVPGRADSVCARLDADMKRAETERAAYTDHPRVIVVHYGQQMNNYLVVGRQSTASQMIEWAGGTNVIGVDRGMRPLSPELIAQAQPDVILATDFGFDKAGGVENFKRLPGIALTPAAKSGRIYRVEEHDLIYLGPRTGANVLALMKLIHGR